ncbi:MAG: hypothetical protein KatS3mg095_0622 [Candidatus Parcubacteria bacterium]|nr:MAG: hypothetical protein KatS3mg095_0622 [Candidatus Parcubacteria bacterium]
MDNPFGKFNKFLKSIKSNSEDNNSKTITLDCGCIYETENDQETGEIKLTNNIKLCSKHQAQKINNSVPKNNIIPHHRPEKI